MLKQRPKQFWGMLKSKKNNENEVDMTAFQKFSESIFYDKHISPDEYTPLSNAPTHHIIPPELTYILAQHFKADKSPGLSLMPL